MTLTGLETTFEEIGAPPAANKASSARFPVVTYSPDQSP
jgi:hypothetical protein